MINSLTFGAALAGALGSGLIAGVFFAFSVFIMKALAALPPASGITAMQLINVTVLNPLFLGTFLGTAAVCILSTLLATLRWHKPEAAYLLAGSLLYLLGTLLVTILFNVPRNEALAALDPGSPETANLWALYIKEWTTWNHVRTGAALSASGTFMIALYLSHTRAAAFA